MGSERRETAQGARKVERGGSRAAATATVKRKSCSRAARRPGGNSVLPGASAPSFAPGRPRAWQPGATGAPSAGIDVECAFLAYKNGCTQKRHPLLVGMPVPHLCGNPNRARNTAL